METSNMSPSYQPLALGFQRLCWDAKPLLPVL